MSGIQSIGSNKASVLQKQDNDVVIVSAVRSAITKGKKGGFKDTKPEVILAHILRASYSKANLDPSLIEDISVGNVLLPGGGAGPARVAAIHAGITVDASVSTVNRQCSSGLTAINQIANQIRVGQIDIGIGAGVESMTFSYSFGGLGELSDEVLVTQAAKDCMLPMGITSENVASTYSITRQVQDEFAAHSFQKAAAAQQAGKFVDEIIPISVKYVDIKTGMVGEKVVDQDDGIRSGVTAENLGKLKAAFTKNGSTHAGNASQVSDGAAAVVLARRSVANRLGLPILGKFVGAATVGVPPHIMGVGPAYAIPRVLSQVGLSLSDVDFFEINEAFASQAVYCVEHLGIAFEKVNLHGGAIAIGHPLGCTGARQVATGMNIARQTGAQVFVTSMCIGSGMGMASVFVSEQ